VLKTSSTDTSKEDALAFIKSQAKGTADAGKADALAFIKEQAKQEKRAQEQVQTKIQGSVKRQPAQQSLLVSPTKMNEDFVGPSASSHVSGSIGSASQPVNWIENAANTARQAAIDKAQGDLDAVQRRVNHLHDVMQGDDPRAARRAEQELRAIQPIYRNMYGAYERASGLARTGTTEDQVRAASDALDQAKGNALSASLRLGAALTAKGGNPYSDNDADIQAWVQQATEESSAAHAAEQEAASQYNKLASDLQYQKYASLRGRDDFLLRSGGNAADAKRWKAASFDPAKRMYANVYSRGGDNVEGISNDPYNFIQDDERSIFFYLWNTEGQKAATEYINSIKHLLNERKAQQRQKDIAGIVDSSPLAAAGMSAVSTLLNQASIAGVVDLTVQNIRRMMGDNRPIDYNTPLQAPGQITQQIRSEVSKNLEERFPKAEIPGIVNLASFAYQTGMSLADSGTQLLLNRFGVPEPVTLSLMSGGAAQQAVYDAKERGASDGQALLTGYAAGIAEYAFEKISLDNLVGSIEAKAGETIGEKLTEKWVSKLAKKVGPWIINAGKQGLVEGSEEAFTTLANTVTDLMINGDKSELLKDIDEMGTGPALRKWITGLALDAMGGIISGVGMGMGGNVLRYAGGVAEDAASAARAAAEKESGQAHAETPTEPETRTAPPTPSESNPLAKALDKLRSGEQLTQNDARRIINDAASMQALRESGLIDTVRDDSAGRQQIRQAVESYARLNTNLLTQAQAQGNLETNTEEVVSNGRTIETSDRATAEAAGEQQPQTSFRERARAAAETQRSREILDRAERRSGLGRFLAEYRANRAQRSAETQFAQQNARANRLRDQAEARDLTFTSAAEQGIPGGTEDQTFQIMPTDMLDGAMRTAQQEAAKNGIDLQFMIGQGRVNDSSGDYNFRGWISADRKRMLIQADHSKLTWQQILDHEELHKLIKSAPGYRQAVEDALLSDARLQPYLSSIVDRYAEAYNSLGVTDENKIIEELLADYRAGFDMLDIARGRAGDVRTKATAKKDIRAAERRGVVPAKNNRGAQTQGSASTEITGNRFSMEMPAEETADLIAVHNLTERNLIDMGELGGAPAPSIAIVKADAGHTKYGPISLVYTKDTIDPQADRRNRVFGSDAWTPTSPTVGYKLDEKASKALRSRIENILGEDADVIKTYIDDDNLKDKLNRHNGDFATAYGNEDALKYAFLKEAGRLDRAPTKEKAYSQYMSNESLRELAAKYNVQELFSAGYDETMKIEPELREWLKRDYIQKTLAKGKADRATVERVADALYSKEQPYSKLNSILYAVLQMENDSSRAEVDTEALRTAIRQEFNTEGTEAEYRAWLNDLASGLVAKKGIRNQKDIYTSAGNRREWDSLYDPYTLENIVRAMASEPQRGASTWGVTAGSLQSVTTPEYRNVEEIRADRGRLGAIDQEEFEQLKKGLDARITDAVERIYSSTKHWSDNRFEEYDLLAAAIINAARGAKTESSITRSMSKDGYTIGKDIAQELRQLYRDAAQLPTEYFEAKPMRAVGFDEIAAAVVPSDISAQARKVLDDNGVNTLEYRSGDDADRLAKLNSIPDVKFSRELDRDYLAAVESGDMGTAQRMVDEAAKQAGYTIKAYHGTTDDFTKFSRGEQGRNHDGYLEFGGGFYFTPNENEAREWVRRGRSGLSGKAEPKVMSVYLSQRNIINADEPIPRGAEALQRMGMSKAEANFIAGRTYRFINYLAEDKGFSNTEIQDELKSLGYDAIDATYRNTASGQYVVFDPDQIKSADPVTYDDQGNVIPLSERFNAQDDDIRFSREIDPDTLRDLNEAEKNGDVIHLYRTMEVVEDEDGRKALRSPMADTVRRDPNAGKTPRTAGNIIFRSAPFGYVDENGDVYDVVDGEQTGASWIKADEHPETATMKPGAKWASTNIGKPVSGDNTGVAYNPYNHASNYVLNDQFKGAYERPNLVTVEVIVPRSEEDHPYHADMAKDPVGWADWKSGDVATALAKAGGEPRRLFLSRWMKVARVLSDAEVADRIVNHDLKGTGIKIPANTVTPSLREALREIDPDIISEPQNPKSYYAYQSKMPSGNTSREIDPQEIAKAEYLTEQRRTGRTGGRGRKRVSRVRTHAFELGGLYNEVEAQMAETQPGEFSYDPISEQKSMQNALGRLRRDFAGEVEKLSTADQWGGSDLDTAMGILHQYRQIGRETGDYSLFHEWSHVIQEKGTKGGQFVQAFAKYSRTATEQARKASERLRETAGKLTPAEQKRIQGHVSGILGAVDGAVEGAAKGAVEDTSGRKPRLPKEKKRSEQRARDAENVIRQIHRIFNQKYARDHGAPVDQWVKLTGDELADRISRRFDDPSNKERTTMQIILGDLMAFAEEHALPDRPEGQKPRTAVERITDYLNNREAYAQAWDEAKQVLRAMYAEDEERLAALDSFLNATITYNGGDMDQTMFRAILESADTLGLSKKDILNLAAAGVNESTINRIADEFAKQVGSDEVRDAVARHITNLVMEDDQAGRLGRMEQEAARELDQKLQSLLRESRKTKTDAANAIAQYLINDLGITGTDAAIAADYIAGDYMDRLAAAADKALRKMFEEKGERVKPAQRDKLLDLFRLGGLTNANVEDAVVDALGLGKLSRAEQRQIMDSMASFADTLDAMADDDLEGLRSLIRQQAAVRNTKLDRMAEKVLSGETDVEYLRNLAMAQLDLIAADYKPRTAGEKISTVQIISHLLNARTAMRNLTSNQVFDMVDSLANNVGLLPDIIMGAITGQRSVGLNKSWASQQKRQGALQGAGRNLLEIALDAAPNDRNQSKYGTGGRRTFAMASSGTVGKILSQAERILGYELNTTDEFHKGSVYGETMESLARFVDRGDMTVEQAAEFATDMALYRSFQDSTVIGSILGGLKDVLNIIGTGTTNGKTIKGLPVHDFGLGDLVVKYTQVPGALIHRAIEFSPVGYLKAIYNIAQLGNLKSKGESTLAKQRAAALSIGRATTGTGLITLFALLAKAGLLRRKDDEKDKNAAALRQSQGFNGTQLNVSALGRMLSGGSLDVQEGDVLADIGFLEPLDSLMTIAALAVNDPEIKAMDLYDMFRNLKTAGKMGEKSLQGIWLALEDTSAMQTLSNIYSTVRYHDEANDLPLYMQIPMEIAASSVSGFIPAPIRQIAQATDTVYRDQYRSQNLLEQTAAKVANAIPGVRQQLAPKLTPLGEEKAYQAPALNALNALLSPGNISVYHSTAVTDEFLRVYDETGEAKILPERNAPYSITINKEKYTLTPDERTQYQETRGKVTTQFADAVRKSKWYKALPADEQAEVLNWCGNFANYVAKTAFMTERGEEYTSKTYAKYYDEWQSGAIPADVAAKANKQNPDGTASRSVPTLNLPTA
jgi:hypothetical protein